MKRLVWRKPYNLKKISQRKRVRRARKEIVALLKAPVVQGALTSQLARPCVIRPSLSLPEPLARVALRIKSHSLASSADSSRYWCLRPHSRSQVLCAESKLLRSGNSLRSTVVRSSQGMPWSSSSKSRSRSCEARSKRMSVVRRRLRKSLAYLASSKVLWTRQCTNRSMRMRRSVWPCSKRSSTSRSRRFKTR